MAQDTRYWDNGSKIFHRKSNLFYVLGEALPTNAALQATHGYRINPLAQTGGLVSTIYRAVFLEGGAVATDATANVESFGQTITPGTLQCGVFPGISITHANITRIEEVEVQYAVQVADTHTTIQAALVVGLLAAIAGAAPAGFITVRCTNPEANNTEIGAGLSTKWDAASFTSVAAVISITAKAGTFTSGNDFEFGFLVRDKPPTALVVNANGVPRRAGIRNFGFTRAFKGNFSATEAEILADQALPRVASYLSAQGGNATFEMLQNDDPALLPVVSGTAVGTNDSTRDMLLLAARQVQSTYSLFMICPNAILENAYDYLWLYRVRSAQLDIARELRNVSPIAVSASCDVFLNRSDGVGHYGIAYSM